MSLARILSRTQLGLEAPLVQVELHLGRGLPGFTIVGLPAPVVRESRERVRAALLNSACEFPAGRITVNLAPVELSKQGGRFDLPIALGLLIASGQLCAPQRAFECYGELGLAGELRPVSGLFLAALHAAGDGHALIVPAANGSEVALSGHAAAYTARRLCAKPPPGWPRRRPARCCARKRSVVAARRRPQRRYRRWPTSPDSGRPSGP
jgi:magnesium chelatase family protein